MVKARKERRWARVATAVALCLPCSSFLSFRCTRLTLLRLKAARRHCRRCAHSHSSTAKCSLCSGRCRKVRHRRVRCPPCVPSRNTSVRKRRCQRKPLRALNVTPLHQQPGVCPRPVKTGGKPGCAEEKRRLLPARHRVLQTRPGVRRGAS